MARQKTRLNKRKRHQSGHYKKSSQQWLAQKVRLFPALAIFSVLIFVVFGMHLNGSEAGSEYTIPDQNSGYSSASGKGITLVVYSDLQCPACAYYHRIIKKLQRHFGSKLRVENRHFPLLKIHQNAALAALSVEAAGRQGRLTEMQDLLFQKQAHWRHRESVAAEALFIEYAAVLELDLVKFQSDLSSAELAEKVHRELLSGIRLGVQATPTFFIDGFKITSYPANYAAFKGLVQSTLNRLYETKKVVKNE